jgi:hypothetical protein
MNRIRSFVLGSRLTVGAVIVFSRRTPSGKGRITLTPARAVAFSFERWSARM